MKSQILDLNGRRPIVAANGNASKQRGPGAHLFAPGDFLDDTAFHRIQLMYGRSYTGGANGNHAAFKHAPAGKMTVFDKDHVYAFCRLPYLHCWVRALEFHIYAAPRSAPSKGQPKTPKYIHVRDKSKLKLLTKKLTSPSLRFVWSQYDPNLFARAMVLTNSSLFVAGPPAIRNETTEDAMDRWLGKKGGILWSLSRKDGSKQHELRLPAQPVFDGMAAANGRLYIALQNGSIVCLQGR
jgi:hypothetical protein